MLQTQEEPFDLYSVTTSLSMLIVLAFIAGFIYQVNKRLLHAKDKSESEYTIASSLQSFHPEKHGDADDDDDDIEYSLVSPIPHEIDMDASSF